MSVATPWLPVDIHAHANGMMTNTMCVKLAKKYGIKLPIVKKLKSTGEDFVFIDEQGKRHWNKNEPASFHEAYDASVGLAKSADDLYEVVKDYLLNAHAQGCPYVEILASGMNNFRAGHAPSVFADNMNGIIKAIDEARAETGIEASIVVTAKRHLKNSVQQAEELYSAAELFIARDPARLAYIRGFNMAGDENVSLLLFKDVFKAFQALLGNKLEPDHPIAAPHAGEVTQSHDVAEALSLRDDKGNRIIGRIGHGLSAIDDISLMEMMRDQSILVEMLISANEQMQGKRFSAIGSHPIRRYFDFGMPMGVGTDDAGIFETTIGNEYQKLHSEYGFSANELMLMSAVAMRHSFAPIAVKEKVLAKLHGHATAHQLDLPDELFELSKPVHAADIIAGLPRRSAQAPHAAGNNPPELRT